MPTTPSSKKRVWWPWIVVCLLIFHASLIIGMVFVAVSDPHSVPVSDAQVVHASQEEQ